MPIIQLSKGLQKKKGRGRPKKRDGGSMSASGKISVKRKQLEGVVTGSDLMVPSANCVGNKKLCSGACSDKAKETHLVWSHRGPP